MLPPCGIPKHPELAVGPQKSYRGNANTFLLLRAGPGTARSFSDLPGTRVPSCPCCRHRSTEGQWAQRLAGPIITDRGFCTFCTEHLPATWGFETHATGPDHTPLSSKIKNRPKPDFLAILHPHSKNQNLHVVDTFSLFPVSVGEPLQVTVSSL